MTALLDVPAARIVAAVADAAERWSDADFPPRVRVLDAIAQRTLYSIPVIEYALDRLFFSLTRESLEETIRAELGSLDALDGFAAHTRSVRAYAAPVGRVCIVSSRTTIGVAIVPAVFALCAKCDVLVKDREDLVVSAFFETLAQERDEFYAAARAQHWRSDEAATPLLDSFDAVVAFGTDEALHAIARQCAPQARFSGFGSRASAGYVTRETLADQRQSREVAQAAARDLVLYESEGCLSLHVLFVEEDAGAERARAFFEMLEAAVDAAALEFPPGTPEPARAARSAAYRGVAAFRAAGGHGAVYGKPGAHAIIVNPPQSEPPAFLPRTLGVHAVREPAQALQYLKRHAVPLEAFAVSQGRDDVVRMVLESGAVRIAPFGTLQDPPASGHHGGQERIAGFVRWIDTSL